MSEVRSVSAPRRIIFVVKNEKVFTPPLSSGCLEGVTRGVLMEIASEAGTSVGEQTLRH